jgi:hypothetical protein
MYLDFSLTKVVYIWYFSISDVRDGNVSQILYRQAKHHQDYTGGRNRYATLEFGKVPTFDLKAENLV